MKLYSQGKTIITDSEKTLYGYNDNEVVSTTFTDGKKVNRYNGDLYDWSDYSATDYIDVENCNYITLTRLTTTSSGSSYGMAFYDENKKFVSGTIDVVSETADLYVEETVYVPSKVKYIRTSWYKSTHANYGKFSCIKYFEYDKMVELQSAQDLENIDEQRVVYATANDMCIYIKDLPVGTHYIKLTSENPMYSQFRIRLHNSDYSSSEYYQNARYWGYGDWIKITTTEEYPIFEFYASYSGASIDPVKHKVYIKSTRGGLEESIKHISLDGTVVLFGDSNFENWDQEGISPSDWMESYSSLNVINCGIGGTLLKQRATPSETPTSSSQAYAALDMINLVKAACAQDFTIPEAGAQWLVDNGSSDDNRYVVERLKSIDWDNVDAVILMGGHNDWLYNNYGTSDSTDVNTSLGAMNEMIRLICTTYPHVRFYFASPTVKWFENESGELTEDTWCDNYTSDITNDKLSDFVDLLINQAKMNHIPVCDLYWTAGINKWNHPTIAHDGAHWKWSFGYKWLAKKLLSFLAENKTW